MLLIQWILCWFTEIELWMIDQFMKNFLIKIAQEIEKRMTNQMMI
jgi:hypothetical protein